MTIKALLIDNQSESINWLNQFNTNNIAAITYGLVYKAGVASMDSDEFINDPRHPRFAKGGKFIDLANKD